MKLYLMRHAATVGNEERRYVGRTTDEPLSELGRTQCERAGVCPQVQKVYVSPLRRARQTAQLCFPEAEQEPVAGLEEYDFGVFEGRRALDMVADEQYRTWVDGGCVGRCPGGESRAEYCARTNAALSALLQGSAQRGEEQVIVVAHGGTIMAALSAFAQVQGKGDNYFAWQVDACEGYAATVCLTSDRVMLKDLQHFKRLDCVTNHATTS